MFAVLGKAVTSIWSLLYLDSSIDIAVADCSSVSSLKLNKSELSLKVASFFEKCYLNVTAVVNRLPFVKPLPCCINSNLLDLLSVFFFLITFNYFSSLLIWRAG